MQRPHALATISKVGRHAVGVCRWGASGGVHQVGCRWGWEDCLRVLDRRWGWKGCGASERWGLEGCASLPDGGLGSLCIFGGWGAM